MGLEKNLLLNKKSGIIYGANGHNKGETKVGKREKLLEAIRNNPVDIPFETIKNLLFYYGCTLRVKKHYVFSHPALDYIITIPRGRKIKAVYAKEAIRMVDDIIDALSKD